MDKATSRSTQRSSHHPTSGLQFMFALLLSCGQRIQRSDPLDPSQLVPSSDGGVRYQRPSWCAPCAPCDCLCADPVGVAPRTEHVLIGDPPNPSLLNMPQFRASLTTPFWIGRHELTVRCLGLCQRAGACEPFDLPEPAQELVRLPQRADYAARGLTKTDAERACAFFHGSVPTQAQWILTARGTDGRFFPWGNERICDGGNYANISGPEAFSTVLCVDGGTSRELYPVGSFPRGAGPSGTLDLLGGVAEWVSDFAVGVPWHEAMLRMNQQGTEPLDPVGPLNADTPELYANGVLRGPTANVFGIGGADRAPPPGFRQSSVGVRCRWDRPPGP